MRYEVRVNLPDMLTFSQLVSSGAAWLMTVLRILLIILIALVFRWLAHRAIRRMVRNSGSDQTPLVLRPLKERAPALAQATGLLSERRRQRAQTIGSVLRNVASIAIFTITVLMILSELDINLAPLLASAGIAGVALGFGAQYVVRDVISGMFMIVEDQYGVGDTVDFGEAVGEVEAVGLRVTTVRDVRGVLWYVRNGEVIRVGNHSQGWARAVVDVPIGLGTSVDEAVSVIRDAAQRLAADPDLSEKLIEAPEIWGVENVTVDSAVVRVVIKTVPDAQADVARRLRRQVIDALHAAGLSSLANTRVYVRSTAGAEASGGTAQT